MYMVGLLMIGMRQAGWATSSILIFKAFSPSQLTAQALGVKPVTAASGFR